MKPLFQRLQTYPFERLRELTRDITPNPALKPISLGLGEPKRATPEVIELVLVGSLSGLAMYPATVGEPALRQASADWVQRRYGVALGTQTQMPPVSGSREALFALAQTVIDPTRANATVVCPNPFYPIYAGAALLAGAQLAFANSASQRNSVDGFSTDWRSIPDSTWAATQWLDVCSPGNPTGAETTLAE